MTVIGKLLAVLNLVVGLGILTWSVSLYTHRPTWFDEIPESIAAGQHPENFKMMAADIKALNDTAIASVKTRAAQRKVVDDLEAKRADRLKKYEERLQWAKAGNPNDKDKAGFYEPEYEAETGLLDLAKLGTPIKGTDNLPLKGSEVLMASFQKDVAKVAELSEQIVKQRDEFAKIGVQILATANRSLKMTEILESVQAEAFFLSAFDTSAKLERLVVQERKKQLLERLNTLNQNEPKKALDGPAGRIE